MNASLIATIIILMVSLLANILLGAVVYSRDPKNRLNQSFFALSVMAAIWVLTNMLFAIWSQELKYILAFASYGAAALLAMFFLIYTMELVGFRKETENRLEFWAVGLGLVATIFAVWPGVLAVDVTSDGQIITNAIPLSLYGVYLVTLIVAGISLLVRARAHARDSEKSKFSIILFGLALAAIIGMFFNLLLPLMGSYRYVQFGPAATLVFVATSTYAIIRHRLFDIRLAAVRTIAYACVLLALSGIYYLAAYVLSVSVLGGQVTDSISVSPVNVILALLLAFLFQPFKRFFDRTTDRIFYRNAYKSDEFFERVSSLLVSTTDLRAILERASIEIGDTLKAKQSFFFVYYAEDRFTSAGTRHHSRLPIGDARTFDQYFQSHDDSVVLTEQLTEGNPVRRILVSHKVDLVMPLRRSNEIIGYLCLGASQLNGYVKRDIRALETITNELVIAIQNALSVQEVKEINATLQQRVDDATRELRKSNEQLRHLDETKDEFISMASHQLRTPLTSIKGYISMVIEGDMGKITPQQEAVLKESFNSSERMVRLISDFLNVSRLQTGKFVIEKHSANLADVIRQEVGGLQVIAASHQMKLAYQVPADIPEIDIDEAKIRQVIMNFIDNAIYYSRPESTITITLEKKDDKALFIVSDTGIGVPEAEQGKLFAKFFRATNARKQRPDGTGVGLFLAKKVITAHGGTMVFSSTEGKGSKFGFMIPLVQK